MEHEICVFISRGHSRDPGKRGLEQALAEALAGSPGIRVRLIGDLHDLRPDGPGVRALQAVGGDLILLAWHYPRSIHWILDRCGVRGHFARVPRVGEADERAASNTGHEASNAAARHRVLDDRPLPPRSIYSLDLRTWKDAEPFLDEIRRIAEVPRQRAPEARPRGRFDGASPQPRPPEGRSPHKFAGPHPPPAGRGPVCIDEDASRRWYPVIDFSRCTNCLECIDFCLFGVYGIDASETILVEQPDNCRKGCPACSRVCPENAIMFPRHRSPAIAGADVGSSELKLDLSRLFGAPEVETDAAGVAAREREAHRLPADRQAAADSGGAAAKPDASVETPPDDLDRLLDELESTDL